MPFELLYHATALSNFARAFDKYSRRYDKSLLPHRSFPGQFFLLAAEDVAFGVNKAGDLVRRLALAGDEVLVLQTEAAPQDLHENTRTGIGCYVESDIIKVRKLFRVDAAGELAEISVETAMALALRILNPVMHPYSAARPRTFSVLPIARACQARCRFCFSEASVSLEQLPNPLKLDLIESWSVAARDAGAERFVITGGGEPGLLAHEQLVELMRIGRRHFEKTVLITNGVHLARLDEPARLQRLRDYANAGLGVLSISRHHHEVGVNSSIMGLNTRSEEVFRSWRALPPDCRRALPVRLICVLQAGGVQDAGTLSAYLDWAAAEGVNEVCFKELYVSTTLESAYHDKPENHWALAHQVPLSLVTEFMESRGFQVVTRLPWGSPVYSGICRGKPLRVAAYTEPSLFWERTQGVARSWNLMADGACLASLEDPRSALAQPFTTTQPTARRRVDILPLQ